MRGVKVEIAGRECELRYDLNALADLEEVLGRGLSVLFQEEAVGIATIRGLLWAGLKWSRRRQGFTRADAGSLLEQHMRQGGAVADVLPAIVEALRASGLVGQLEEDEEEEAGAEGNPPVPLAAASASASGRRGPRKSRSAISG